MLYYILYKDLQIPINFPLLKIELMHTSATPMKQNDGMLPGNKKYEALKLRIIENIMMLKIYTFSAISGISTAL